MTYSEDIMQAAREAVAATYDCGCTHEIYAGGWDDYGMVQSAAYAIAAERARHEWQPIETAPKDGTRILILDAENGVHIVRYEEVTDLDRAKGFQDGWYDIGTFPQFPTKWKPIEPPQEASK